MKEQVCILDGKSAAFKAIELVREKQYKIKAYQDDLLKEIWQIAKEIQPTRRDLLEKSYMKMIEIESKRFGSDFTELGLASNSNPALRKSDNKILIDALSAKLNDATTSFFNLILDGKVPDYLNKIDPVHLPGDGNVDQWSVPTNIAMYTMVLESIKWFLEAGQELPRHHHVKELACKELTNEVYKPGKMVVQFGVEKVAGSFESNSFFINGNSGFMPVYHAGYGFAANKCKDHSEHAPYFSASFVQAVYFREYNFNENLSIKDFYCMKFLDEYQEAKKFMPGFLVSWIKQSEKYEALKKFELHDEPKLGDIAVSSHFTPDEVSTIYSIGHDGTMGIVIRVDGDNVRILGADRWSKSLSVRVGNKVDIAACTIKTFFVGLKDGLECKSNYNDLPTDDGGILVAEALKIIDGQFIMDLTPVCTGEGFYPDSADF